MIRLDVLNRWSGKVQFTAEIDCAEDAPMSIKLGLSVAWARNSGADLSGADLRHADLSGADLSGADLRHADLRGADLSHAVLRDADLRHADLRGADLSHAVLRDADLRSFKADFWMILTENPREVPALILALKEGRVDGSTYHGECACLVGTIANARGVDVDTLPTGTDSSRPAEQWFLMIKEGDKPGDDTGGGFASGEALKWAEEWFALSSDTIPEAA
jgi:hypothetical protein